MDGVLGGNTRRRLKDDGEACLADRRKETHLRDCRRRDKAEAKREEAMRKPMGDSSSGEDELQSVGLAMDPDEVPVGPANHQFAVPPNNAHVTTAPWWGRQRGADEPVRIPAGTAIQQCFIPYEDPTPARFVVEHGPLKGATLDCPDALPFCAPQEATMDASAGQVPPNNDRIVPHTSRNQHQLTYAHSAYDPNWTNLSMLPPGTPVEQVPSRANDRGVEAVAMTFRVTEGDFVGFSFECDTAEVCPFFGVRLDPLQVAVGGESDGSDRDNSDATQDAEANMAEEAAAAATQPMVNYGPTQSMEADETDEGDVPPYHQYSMVQACVPINSNPCNGCLTNAAPGPLHDCYLGEPTV
jgi:hypothetical protein